MHIDIPEIFIDDSDKYLVFNILFIWAINKTFECCFVHYFFSFRREQKRVI